ESPAESAKPAPTTMHSPTLANDFSFRLTLAFASFQPLLSRCARCLSSKPCVLRALRTLFLSLLSFRRSPRLFSIACRLFLQNTGVWGYLCDISAPSAPLRYHLPLSCGSFYFHPLTNPLSTRIDLQYSLFSCIYKFLFPQLLCIHIYTKRPGVTPTSQLFHRR